MRKRDDGEHPRYFTIHFGIMPEWVDWIIWLGMNETRYKELGYWNPPIITHGDDWEEWNEPIKGAVHMCMAVDTRDWVVALNLLQNDLDVMRKIVTMQFPNQIGTRIVVTQYNNWGAVIDTVK